MASKFEEWRQVDRMADEAERRARSLVRRAGDPEYRQRADIDRARRLRALADVLLDPAMAELGGEVQQIVAQRTAVDPTPSIEAGSAMPVWDRGGFLRATAPEDATFSWFLDAVSDIRQVTMGRPEARVLFDLTAVRRRPSLPEQTMLGEHVARQLAHLERAASIVGERERTGYSERAARALGMNLRVFTSAAEAIDWLTAGHQHCAAGMPGAIPGRQMATPAAAQ